jgi:DNA primase small subunit
VIARIEAKFDLTQLNKNNPKKLFLKQDIYLSLLYPRLDEKVSTTINHLLKSPFSMHVKTGKVCVPFTYEQIDRFNIDEVPTVLEL